MVDAGSAVAETAGRQVIDVVRTDVGRMVFAGGHFVTLIDHMVLLQVSGDVQWRPFSDQRVIRWRLLTTYSRKSLTLERR